MVFLQYLPFAFEIKINSIKPTITACYNKELNDAKHVKGTFKLISRKHFLTSTTVGHEALKF